jgi:hypothetical protein
VQTCLQRVLEEAVHALLGRERHGHGAAPAGSRARRSV